MSYWDRKSRFNENASFTDIDEKAWLFLTGLVLNQIFVTWFHSIPVTSLWWWFPDSAFLQQPKSLMGWRRYFFFGTSEIHFSRDSIQFFFSRKMSLILIRGIETFQPRWGSETDWRQSEHGLKGPGFRTSRSYSPWYGFLLFLMDLWRNVGKKWHDVWAENSLIRRILLSLHSEEIKETLAVLLGVMQA